MDIVNTLETIIPKMRGQMYQKKIYSLAVVNEIVEKEGKYYSINDLDIFFAKIGVYLKSQEVTELLNHCQHSKTQIDLIRMVNLLKTEIPKELVQCMEQIFEKISGKQQVMDVEELFQHLNEKEYPQSELMNNNHQVIRDTIIKEIYKMIDNNKVISKEQFITFHYNIFWVLPNYRIKDFKYKLPRLWGIRKL